MTYQIFLKNQNTPPILWTGSKFSSIYSLKLFLKKKLKYNISIEDIQFQFLNKNLHDNISLYQYSFIENNSTINYSYPQKGGLEILPILLIILTIIATYFLCFLFFSGMIPLFSHFFFEGFGNVINTIFSFIFKLLHIEKNHFVQIIKSIASGILKILKLGGIYPFVYALTGGVAFSWYSLIQVLKNNFSYCDVLMKSSHVGKIMSIIFIIFYIILQLPTYFIEIISMFSTLFMGKTSTDLVFDPILKNINNIMQSIYSATFYPIPIYGQILAGYHTFISLSVNSLFDMSNSVNSFVLKLENIRRKLLLISEKTTSSAEFSLKEMQTLSEKSQHQIPTLDEQIQLEKYQLFIKDILGVDYKKTIIESIHKIKTMIDNINNSQNIEQEQDKIIKMKKDLQILFYKLSIPIGIIIESPLKSELATLNISNQLFFAYIVCNFKFRKLIRDIITFNEQPNKNNLELYNYLITLQKEEENFQIEKKEEHTFSNTETTILQHIKKFIYDIKDFFSLVWFGQSTKNKLYSYDDLLTLSKIKPKEAIEVAKSIYRYQFFAEYFFNPEKIPIEFMYVFLNTLSFIGNSVYTAVEDIAGISEGIYEYGGVFEIINQIKVVSSISLFMILVFFILLIIYYFY